MPVLGNDSTRPSVGSWEVTDFDGIIRRLNALKSEVPPPKELIQQLTTGAAACIAALAGQEVWMADEPTMERIYFAVGPRFVPEADWHLDLDELISEGAYIVTEEGADVDLFVGEPLAAVVEALSNHALLKVTNGTPTFDSFADEREVQSVVTRALEEWEMSLPKTGDDDSATGDDDSASPRH